MNGDVVDIGAYELGSLIVVDTTNDVVDAGDGVTSLREALLLARTSNDANTIGFDGSYPK